MTDYLVGHSGPEILIPETAGWIIPNSQEVHMEVIITHPKTGESYGIDSADFRRGKHYRDPRSGDMKTYESAGFEIVSLADGSEYTPPTPRHPAQDEHAP